MDVYLCFMYGLDGRIRSQTEQMRYNHMAKYAYTF